MIFLNNKTPPLPPITHWAKFNWIQQLSKPPESNSESAPCSAHHSLSMTKEGTELWSQERPWLYGLFCVPTAEHLKCLQTLSEFNYSTLYHGSWDSNIGNRTGTKFERQSEKSEWPIFLPLKTDTQQIKFITHSFHCYFRNLY